MAPLQEQPGDKRKDGLVSFLNVRTPSNPETHRSSMFGFFRPKTADEIVGKHIAKLSSKLQRHGERHAALAERHDERATKHRKRATAAEKNAAKNAEMARSLSSLLPEAHK
ncbi:MAG TPA: hypothetical protein VKT73_12945 [Xanthobacteraceae bacterium]|nr:hypothetical protein [Xanthobacteraceae bacterium]